MNIVETTELSKIYGGKAAVNGVSMHIPEGSIYGFVGENGSGKTTIMRLLTGLATPSKGSFTLFGVKNNEMKIYAARKQISAIVEATSLVPSMTAIDNIIYQENYLGVKLKKEERMELLKIVHLDQTGKKKVKNFSLGMRQRLGIAMALMNKPKLMLLDEPLNGLDPQGIAELRDLLIEINKNEGITILISSHILSELEKIATTYGFISHGRLIEEVTVDELQNRCRKSTTINVEDVKKAEEVITKEGIKDYKAFPNGDIIVYDDIDIGEFISNLYKNKIKIHTVNSSDESVEEYYLNLVKGE